jgi:hypothetical protein
MTIPLDPVLVSRTQSRQPGGLVSSLVDAPSHEQEKEELDRTLRPLRSSTPTTPLGPSMTDSATSHKAFRRTSYSHMLAYVFVIKRVEGDYYYI